VDCETRLCSQFLGPGDHFLQSYGAICTDRAATMAATGSGNLKNSMSTIMPGKICKVVKVSATAVKI
jgi:hypothetical protein